MAKTLDMPLEVVQEHPHKLLNILRLSMPGEGLIILINEGLLEPVKGLWHVPASILAMSK